MNIIIIIIIFMLDLREVGQDQCAEILVNCVFWYYNSTESCLRPRERCDNSTVGKN